MGWGGQVTGVYWRVILCQLAPVVLSVRIWTISIYFEITIFCHFRIIRCRAFGLDKRWLLMTDLEQRVKKKNDSQFTKKIMVILIFLYMYVTPLPFSPVQFQYNCNSTKETNRSSHSDTKKLDHFITCNIIV